MAAPLLNRPTTLRALFDLAAAITARYRADGYILSRAVVTAQRIEGGAAHIRIVEGYIETITLEGRRSARLAAYARRIKDSRPLRVAVLERFLLLANDLPGVSVRAVVSPSTGAAGGADLTLIVSRKEIEASIGGDNSSSRFFGPDEVYAAATFNDVLGLDERTSVRAGSVFPYRQMHYYQAQEDVPIGDDGLTLSAAATINIGHPDFTLSPLDPSTQGISASVKLTYPVIRSRSLDWRVWADFDIFDGRSVLDHAPTTPPSSDDDIRSLRLGTSYDSIDSLGGANLVRLEFSQGLLVFDPSANNRPNPSRPGGRGDYDKLAFYGDRTQDLSRFAPGLSLDLRLTAQDDFNTGLLAPEQLGLGGTYFGLGYDPSEITGDYEIAGATELRETIVTSLGPGVPLRLQPYVFYDVGEVGSHHAPIGMQRESIASTGAGVRATVNNRLALDLVLAEPLTRVPEEEYLAGKYDKPLRLYLSVSVNF